MIPHASYTRGSTDFSKCDDVVEILSKVMKAGPHGPLL
jgi:hypothetical protein